jgi:hypothetical protein
MGISASSIRAMDGLVFTNLQMAKGNFLSRERGTRQAERLLLRSAIYW